MTLREEYVSIVPGGKRWVLTAGRVFVVAALGGLAAATHFIDSTNPSSPAWQVVPDEGGTIRRLTYTNVLTEDLGGERIVYLPHGS